MLPSLSILIPSHNRPDLLRLCLASVTRHAPAGTEVVVVDDGSPRAAATTAAREFAGVQVVRRRRRRGFCAAVNTGLRAVSGTVVELLNDDAEVTAGWAEPALRQLQDPVVAAVAPLVLIWPGEAAGVPRIDSAGDRYYVGGIAGKRGHGDFFGPAYLRSCRVFGASGSSAFYRRQALEQVGAFPESFGAYFEDVDLAFRLHRAGYQVVYEPASRVLHRVGASQGRLRRRLLEQQSCNEERVFWRNLAPGTWRRAVPAHLAVLLAKAWRRWREGTFPPFLCGRLRVLGEVPALVRHRRRLRQLGPGTDTESWLVENLFWGVNSARGGLDPTGRR